jgi:WD40 repeat protein
MNKKKLLLSILIAMVLVTSCTINSQVNDVPNTGNDNIVTKTDTATQSPQISVENTNTALPTQTSTVSPTSTPEPLNLTYLGTAIPTSEPLINTDNFSQLQQNAVWGRGNISDMAFSPSGDQFVISSPLGFAIYDVAHIEDPPEWIAFDTPINHQFITFSENGNFIKFFGYKREKRIFGFPSGEIVDNDEDNWRPIPEQSIWGSLTMNSADGSLTFSSSVMYNEENMDIEYSIRQITNNDTEETYDLGDDTFYLKYDDHYLPEGCSITFTGMCWNAYSPSTFYPYLIEFSPNNKTLAIIYRVTDYSNSPDYSVLRVYDAATGTLLSMVGDLEHPVSTFAYSPDSSQLLIGFKNGSAQIWNIAGKKSIFDTWNFNDSILNTEYSKDGEFLLIQRPHILEIRSAYDGALRSRLETENYVLSPIDNNIIYFTDDDFMIKAMEMDSGSVILRIPAHEKEILAVAISEDGRYIASSSLDCKVKLWDARTGKFLHYLEETIVDSSTGGPQNLEPEHRNSRIFIYTLKFNKDTDQIIGFGSWGAAVNWNLNSGATNYVIYSAQLGYYPDLMTVNNHVPKNYYVDVDHNAFYIDDIMFDLSSGEIISTDHETAVFPEYCRNYGPTFDGGESRFTPGYGDNENKICVLDNETNQLTGLISPHGGADETHEIKGLLVSPDGKQLVISNRFDVVEIYTIGE